VRPSVAGPMLPPLVQLSSARVRVFMCLIPPMPIMFLPHASGREFVLPVFDCDCRMTKSLSSTIWSMLAETVVYWGTWLLPVELVWNSPR